MAKFKPRIANFKKEFQKILDELCGSKSRFQVWNDFIHTAAYSISNCANYKQDREDRYLQIMKQYGDEAGKLADLLVVVVRALDDNRNQDFLGEFYMDLSFGDKARGQYFTPYSIAEMMAKMVGFTVEEGKSFHTVTDPCCGSGVMLIAYINTLLESDINFQQDLLVVAADIDPCIALMCYIQLSLFGCAGYVCVRNSLINPITENGLCPPEDAYIMPMLCTDIWQMRCLLMRLHE